MYLVVAVWFADLADQRLGVVAQGQFFCGFSVKLERLLSFSYGIDILALFYGHKRELKVFPVGMPYGKAGVNDVICLFHEGK